MRAIRLTVAVGLLAAALPATASAKCGMSGSKKVFENAKGQAFTKGGRSYGCLKSTGMNRLLETSDGTTEDPLGVVKINGPYIAYEHSQLPGPDPERYVVVKSLQTGKLFRRAVVSRQEEVVSDVTEIVLKPTGSVAWIRWFADVDFDDNGPQPRAYSVWRMTKAGKKRLDKVKAPAPDPVPAVLRKLRLKGSALSWLSEGTAKSSTLG